MTGFNDYYHQSQPTSNLHQQDNDSDASILFRIIYIYIYIHIKPTSTITYYIMLPIYERTNNEYEQKNEKKRVFRLFERSTTIQLQAGDHLPFICNVEIHCYYSTPNSNRRRRETMSASHQHG